MKSYFKVSYPTFLLLSNPNEERYFLLYSTKFLIALNNPLRLLNKSLL